MRTYWFPAYGHPEGTRRDRPWFRLEGDQGYRATGHPDGPSNRPCFQVVQGDVWPTLSLPGPAANEVSFVVIGSFVYRAEGREGPWFRVQTGWSPCGGGDVDREAAPGACSRRGDTPTDRHRSGVEASRPDLVKGAAMAPVTPKPSSSVTRTQPPFQRSYREVNPAEECPGCGSASICWVPSSDGVMNYLCEACGRCWTSTSNGTVRVSPIACPGCEHRQACFDHLRAEIAAFAWRPA